MDILKKVLIIVGSVIGLFLLIALFLPDKMKVERSVEVAKPVSEVYPLVADFSNWNKWSPWTEMEPTAKTSVSGTPMQPGHTWTWKGKDVGSGEMKLDEAKANESLATSLTFKAPMESTALCYWKFEPAAAGTKVTWSFVGDADYPMGRVFGLFVDGQLGPQFDKGLSNLKKLAEGK